MQFEQIRNRALLTAIFSLALAGCSSSEAVQRAGSGAGGSTGSGGATSGGSGNSGSGNAVGGNAGSGAGGSPITGAGGTIPVGTGDGGVILQVPTDGGVSSCAAATAEAPLRPVMLAFMLDRSGSMACGPHVCGTKGAENNTAQRWTPVTTALKAVFADPGSTGLSASMTFFPLTKSDGTTCGTAECDPTAYGTPSVPMTALPEPTLFANAIDANFPACHPGTPMITAFEGAIPYVQGLASSDPLAQVAMVLVTDVTTGEPYEVCKSLQGTAAINAVAAQLSSVAATIPTYVIGVGSVTSLQTLAQAGGTGSAYLVSITDPTLTQTEFSATIGAIRQAAVPCDVAIPPPPTGETLDPGLVNVTFTPVSGAPILFSMSSDCSGDQGWRYDDPLAPTRIELCPGACQSVKSQFGGRLDVAFGCATRVF